MADLSKETLESLTDEVKSSGSFSSSGGLQPWSSASGSKSESGSQPSRSEYGDHQSELSDFKANVKKLSRKWIHNLKGKETKSEQYRADTKYQTEITQASLEELNALQSFCTVKGNKNLSSTLVGTRYFSDLTYRKVKQKSLLVECLKMSVTGCHPLACIKVRVMDNTCTSDFSFKEDTWRNRINLE
ncbi:hypothetical protein MG293_020325 [Ovis ammon polii]|uniref:Uncharacterized protein n=1 Tax=Ovis ammon polii TaxID=230172 RepID=A0AAD4Y0N5_OVIAM|nr:hypothetical protein MG293_020325 [Ovis ammon polii]